MIFFIRRKFQREIHLNPIITTEKCGDSSLKEMVHDDDDDDDDGNSLYRNNKGFGQCWPWWDSYKAVPSSDVADVPSHPRFSAVLSAPLAAGGAS